MTKLKRKILLSISITLVLYTIIYLFISFAIWELNSPFQWIVNLPKYNVMDRFGILCSILGYYGVNCLFVDGYINTKWEKAKL